MKRRLIYKASFWIAKTYMDISDDDASIKVGQAIRAAGVPHLKSRRLLITLALSLVILCGLASWNSLKGLLRGDFDSGKFEIIQSQWISATRLAMLARRSDHTALSGDTYFVLIGNHPYSSQELRESLYGHQSIFVAGRDGVVLRQANPKELIIECKECGITKDRIEDQRFSDGDVAIRYDAFP